MADNLTTQSSTLATIPSGSKISTDEDATNGHVQRMKLAVSADGSSTHVGADANGLQVQGAAADGATVAGNPVLIGGDDGTNAVNVAVNSSGHVAIQDGGNSLTVDGTVTANLSATDNAVLDQIDSNTDYGAVTGGGVEASALRVTIASDSTGVVSVDDNGGSLTVDNADITTIAGAVSGSEMQVDIVSGNVTNAGTFAVQVENADTVSSNNSTSTPLTGGASFTGTADDCLGYSTVTINLFADVDSAANGMSFEFSSDGTNWDDVYTFTLDASASTDRRFQFPVTARYFRLVYTNGAGAQSAFRVQTILHRQNVLTSIHRVDDVVTTDRSAELVKAVMAAKVAEGATASGAVDGEYETLSMTGWRELRTRDQRQLDLADCNDYTVFTTLGNDTLNLADSVNHLFGTGSITFDKVNGAANTVFAGVQDTFTAIDVSERFEAGSFVALGVYLPSVADVAAVFIRVGTDSSNYNEWEWTVDQLSAGSWLALRHPTNQPTGYAGNGWNPAAVAYVAFGVEFNAETDTLAGIIFDNVHMVGGRVTDSTIDASVTSSVNTPNINVQRMGGSAVDTNTGNASAATQRVVLATDQPVVSVDDNGGSLTVDGSVSLAAAIPAGTNQIGDVVVNDIEDGAGTSVMDAVNNAIQVNVVAGSTSGTEYTEDAAAAANPAGTAQILVRQDTPATLVSADGDNVARRGTNYGAAFTQIVDSSGNFIDTFGGSGGTAAADDADFTAGTTQGTPAMGVYESSPTSVTDGDLGTVGITQTRSLKVEETNSTAILADTANMDTNLGTIAGAVAAEGAALGSGVLLQGDDGTDRKNINVDATTGDVQVDVTNTVTVDGSGVTQPVSGTVTANLSATDNAVLDQIEVNTSYGDSVGGGTEAAALRVTLANDSTGVLSVDDNGSTLSVDDGGASLTIDNATLSVTGGGTQTGALRVTVASDSTGVLSVDDNGGSLTVDGTVTASNTAGDVAHDSADSGNPVKVGFKAYNMDGTAPGTAVAENDRANGISDVYGRQFVETAHPNLWQAMGLYSTAQTDTSVKAAPGAGLSLYITDIVVSTDTAFNCFFEQGTTKVYGTLYLAANGGASSHFRTPIKLPANTALTFTSSATANHSITVNGYTAA